MSEIPTDIYKTEIEIKKSRFIGIGFPISSPENARELLKVLREEYSDARHICYAFVWGKKSTHMGMSDDGEPNGTAGRPMLEVVKGSGYENILIAAVRYFGGTKLGTGGLVKAYTEITQNVIRDIPVKEYIESVCLKLNIPYNLYDTVKKIIEENSGIIKDEDFSINISITFEIPTRNKKDFDILISDISKGELKCSIL